MANYRSTTAWKFDERQQYTRGQTSREGRLAPNGTDLRRDRDYPRAITRDNGGVGEITTDTMGQMTEKYESPVNSSRSIDQPRRPRPETDQGGPRTLAAGMHKSYCESSFRVYGRFFTWQFEEPCVDGRKMFNEFIY